MGFCYCCLAWGWDLSVWSSFRFRQGLNWKFKMLLGQDHKRGRNSARNVGAAQNSLCHADQDQTMTQSSLKEMQAGSLHHTKHTSSSFQGHILWSRCPERNAYVIRDADKGFTCRSCLKGRKRKRNLISPSGVTSAVFTFHGPWKWRALHNCPYYHFHKPCLSWRLCSPPGTKPTLS